MSEKHEEVRQSVSRSYTFAVKSGGGCCSTTPKGAAAQLAGYAAEQTADLPPDAVVNSFGCGNPLAFAGVKPGETVLDLGSGAGMDLLIAARAVGPTGTVIGVDMTDAMIERARENMAAAGATNVEVRKGIIEELPVEAGTVDLVISNCVVNLSPEKGRVFREIARVLRPGGRVSISDIVAESMPAWVLDVAALRSACVAGAISEQDYVAGLQAAGLEGVEVTERLGYEVSQIAAIALSELDVDSVDPDIVHRAAAELEGKVWSARFVARKPA